MSHICGRGLGKKRKSICVTPGHLHFESSEMNNSRKRCHNHLKDWARKQRQKGYLERLAMITPNYVILHVSTFLTVFGIWEKFNFVKL